MISIIIGTVSLWLGCFEFVLFLFLSDDGFTFVSLMILYNDWAENGTANQQANKSESPEEFEQRIFSPGRNSKIDGILDKLNQQGKARDRSSSTSSGSGESSPFLDDLEQSLDTLSDGMDGKLNNAARYFEFDPDEIMKEDYSFRYDTTFHQGSTYTIKVCWIAIPTLSLITDFHIQYYMFRIYLICF